MGFYEFLCSTELFRVGADNYVDNRGNLISTI